MSSQVYNEEGKYNQNIVPLGNNEIKSVLKTQSEAVFEQKNISNNSNFVKKSLIDIALAFAVAPGSPPLAAGVSQSSTMN